MTIIGPLHRFALLLLAVAGLGLLLPGAAGASRIKDIASLQGVRDNQLIGYGLVVGLNGSGDSASTQFTIQSLVNMLERLGVSVNRAQVKVSNVAAVMVTAELPPFAKAGNSVDVTISSLGDAKSLAGGTLLMAPLKGPDGQVYAVAQGPVLVGSLSFGGKAAKVQTNHPTVGRIPSGGLIEKEVPFVMPEGAPLVYRIQESDFTTISRMNAVVNARFGAGVAQPLDGASLQVRIPEDFQGRTVEFVAALEGLEVQPDAPARIVVNERTGTIVVGEEVRIATVAVSHGNLNLVINETASVSQPNPLSGGETVVVPETSIQVTETGGELVVLDKGTSIGEVARALNAIGATPRDLIAIFQALKAAGALHAELVVL